MTKSVVSYLGIANWGPDRLHDLTGKLYVVTGSNSGIGFETARILSENGADVILACRNEARAQDAKSRLLATARGDVMLAVLDLSDTQSIRKGAATIRGLTPKIDGLVNNAGVMRTPQQSTKDGFEMQLGTNHLGHFLLTYLLIDLVQASNGRVVTVSSIAHERGRLRFDDLMGQTDYSPYGAYGQSKLANLVFAFELDQRLREANSGAMSVACHPGYSATNVHQSVERPLLKQLYKVANIVLAQPASHGAVSAVLAAAGKEAKRGAYYGPTGFLNIRGPVSDAQVAQHALDRRHWKKLWEKSETLLGIEFDIKEPAELLQEKVNQR